MENYTITAQTTVGAYEEHTDDIAKAYVTYRIWCDLFAQVTITDNRTGEIIEAYGIEEDEEEE